MFRRAALSPIDPPTSARTFLETLPGGRHLRPYLPARATEHRILSSRWGHLPSPWVSALCLRSSVCLLLRGTAGRTAAKPVIDPALLCDLSLTLGSKRALRLRLLC